MREKNRRKRHRQFNYIPGNIKTLGDLSEEKQVLAMDSKGKPSFRKSVKIKRNGLCPCGSEVKYKKCCLLT